MNSARVSKLLDDRFFNLVLVVLAAFVGTAGLSGAGFGGLSNYAVNTLGQLAAFAILAVALDLIWGYLGILSLGHGLYFAIGGYAMAMYLLKHSFVTTGIVPDFMQFMGWKQFPAYWFGFEFMPYALSAGLAFSGLLALAAGYVSFRSKVGGVYFAIITQALVYVAMLLMFRNDTGFGGNNGMTGFAVILGVKLGQPAVTAALAAVAILALMLAMVAARLLVTSNYGRLMLACRDDEVRLRTLGYDTISLKLGVWCFSALLATVAGMLYVPLVGIINPRVLSPELSLEIAVWVAIGGRGRLFGAVIGAFLVNALKFWLSAKSPDLWPFILSGLIVCVAAAFPNGLLDAGQMPAYVATKWRQQNLWRRRLKGAR